MKVRVVTRPLGLLNGAEWPEVGETLDLPDVVAEVMVSAGAVEKVAAKKAVEEKRPASQAKVEKRTASKKS